MNTEALSKIGILGGTFNPVHNGHLLMAETAKEEFCLDKVLFLPTGHSPHKLQNQITDAAMRCDMIRLSIQDNPFFELNLTEVQSERISYTYITLQELKKSYPLAELYFILGADSLLDMEKWREPEEIFSNCKILAAYRTGESQTDFQKQIAYLNEKYNAQIYPMHMPTFEVSSHEIRSRIQNRQSIRYLVSKEVEHYILEKRLYQEEK